LAHCGPKETASDFAQRPHSVRGPSPTSELSGPSPTYATARSLSDCIYPGSSFTRLFNSGGTISLVEGPDPYSRGPPRSPASTLDTTQRHDSLIHGVCHIVRISPRSKCFNTSISVGAAMDSGEYLCMSITTIKCRNVSSYE